MAGPIEAVLFDLDGTLLAYDYAPFEQRLYTAYGTFFARRGPDLFGALIVALGRAIAADGTATVEETFWSAVPPALSRQALTPLIEDFFAQKLPALGAGVGPDPDAASVLQACRGRARIVLATNPVHPWGALRERMRWGGFEPETFEFVTRFEEMHAAKPNPKFYAEVARRLGVPADRCLMVGNDLAMDLAPARAVGMATFLCDNPWQVRNVPDFVPDHTAPLASVPGVL